MSVGNMDALSRNLQYYMMKYGKTRTDVAKDLDIPYTTFCDWINGKRYPRIDKIEMLANYFHCKKSDLIEPYNISADISFENDGVEYAIDVIAGSVSKRSLKMYTSRMNEYINKLSEELDEIRESFPNDEDSKFIEKYLSFDDDKKEKIRKMVDLL